VAAAETVCRLRQEADRVVCLSAPYDFHAVSMWYEDFSQTSDEEVRNLLESAAQAAFAPSAQSQTERVFDVDVSRGSSD
jgi:predicted phosphoribosyltransferase